MAEIVRRQRPDIPLVYQDTGMADPKLTTVIKQYAGKHLVHLAPIRPAEQTWVELGCLPIGAKVSASNYKRQNPEVTVEPSRCCHEHKAKPMNAYLIKIGCDALLVGARGDDSMRHRFKLMTGEVIQPKKLPWVLVYPLLTWLQADVLEFLRVYVPNYPLMYARNEELGCRACAINLARPQNQLTKLRRADPAYHRHLMEECGYAEQILMIRHNVTRKGAKQLIRREGLQQLIDAGHLDRIPNPRKGLR